MIASPDHPNAVQVRQVYSQWFAGVASPMMQLLAADAVYHLPGKHLGGGDLHGREAILAIGRTHAQSFDEPPRSEVLDVTANDQFTITFERFHAERRGRVLDQVVCGVWRLRDGQAVELWAHFEDQAGCDAFWSD